MKISFDTQALINLKDNLLDEFRQAEKGRKTSLAYAVHKFNPEKKQARSAKAIVVGGTNIAAADVTREGLSINFSEVYTDVLPEIDRAERLFEIIEKTAGNSDGIFGLNFAYPMRPLLRDGRLDGILIKGTKEHSFDGLVGKEIGLAVEKFFSDKNRDVTITCANDTVCLVLAGLSGYDPSTLAAGVVGTGFNFGFFNDRSEIVNLESGNFSGFLPSDSCRILDRESRDPGEQLFEKETSGAYLHLHYNIINAERGNAAKKIEDAEELSNAAAAGDKLAEELFEKSASLVAAEIAAIYQFRGKPLLNLTIEGSLYWKGWMFRENVEKYLESLGVPRGAVNIRFIEESSIVGAAELVI